jgi:quercetin dioxygenase-like cupin family protein
MVMNQVSFEAFEKEAHAQGFDEVVERKWAPSTVVESHTHPFAVRALVVLGEMWLDVDGGGERHLLPGDEFRIEREIPHTERYGAEGTTYWAARRNR